MTDCRSRPQSAFRADTTKNDCNMEHIDDTFKEMQQQMQQLRETLDNQKIINENMLRKSYRRDLNSLRSTSSRVPLLCVVAIALAWSFCETGFSVPFFIATELMMLGCLAGSLLINRHIPPLDCNMVTAAEELSKFKESYVNWIRVGIPMLLFWLSWMIAELFIRDFPESFRLPFICGSATGIVLGGCMGLRLRRRIIISAEELLASLQSLKETM